MPAGIQIEVENVKLFEYFSFCPPEIQMMIINMMEPIDRLRFGMCSRRCNAEAKDSINYIHTLEIRFCAADRIVVDVKHSTSAVHGKIPGFKMDFRVEQQHIYQIYLTSDYRQVWWKLLDSSTVNVLDKLGGFALQYFSDLLKYYQRGIKKLSIDWIVKEFNRDFGFGIRNLRNLKELKINGNIDYAQFVSKLSKPLSRLTIDGTTGYQTIVDQPQFFEVKHKLIFPSLQLNNEQFLQLSAPTIRIHIGQLTVLDLVNFIQSWQEGTLSKKFVQVTWSLGDTNFNVSQLFRSLGHRRFVGRRVVIRHQRNPWKRAELHFTAGTLKVTFSHIGSQRPSRGAAQRWEF